MNKVTKGDVHYLLYTMDDVSFVDKLIQLLP